MESVKNIYEDLKKKGLIQPTVLPTYKCGRCHDTGYIEAREGDTRVMVPCKCLEEIKLKARLQHSGICAEEYEKCSLDTFHEDTEEHRKMKALAVKYLNCRKAGEGIGFFGASGTGKTHICIAVCQELTRKYGEPHFYFSYRSEIQKIKAVMYKDGDKYNEIMAHWSTVPNLYIDDLLKFAKVNGQIQAQDLQIMFDVINTRYLNRKSTIFSSEYSLKYITNNIDEALGSRIFAMVTYRYGCSGSNRRMEAR